MSEWLKIVKKHAKMNPGKSLKEYLPDAKVEYQKLKASGKVVLKSALNATKKVGKKIMKKQKKHSKKQRGGGRIDGDDDEPPPGPPVLVRQNAMTDERNEPDEEPEISLDEELQDGGKKKRRGGYQASIFMRGRTRAGGKSRKTRKGGRKSRKSRKSRKGRKGISNSDVATSQMLAAAATMPIAMLARGKAGGKKNRKNKKLSADITSTNLA
jgi:hypothetical protein